MSTILLNITLKNNTIRCEKLATVASGWTNVARPFVAVTFRHSCLPVFVWRRVVLHFFGPKQLVRVSCILWYFFFSKWYSTVLQNASLWCSIFKCLQCCYAKNLVHTDSILPMYLSFSLWFTALKLFVHAKFVQFRFITIKKLNK